MVDLDCMVDDVLLEIGHVSRMFKQEQLSVIRRG